MLLHAETMTAGQSSSEMDLSSTFSCSPTHLSTCLFPFSPLWPIIMRSSLCNIQIHSFFASYHLILSHYLSFELHLPLSRKSKTEMFGVLQPDSIRHGSLRALLLPSSIYNYIIVITSMENSTWLSYNFTLFTLFPPHPLF